MINRGIILLIWCLLFASCEKVTLEPDTIDENTEISFSNDVQPVFTSKCVSCHNSGGLNLLEGSSYESLTNGGYISNPTNYESTKLYKKVTGTHASYTTDKEKQIIELWLKQGAKNN